MGINFKVYSNLSDRKSMLLPSTKRAKLESNEMCNAVQPNEIKIHLRHLKMFCGAVPILWLLEQTSKVSFLN